MLYEYVYEPLCACTPNHTYKRQHEDLKAASELVRCAKYGQWDKVWPILDRKPHLINFIPEERSWAALHQAAFLDDYSAVTYLLNYPNCDPKIGTRKQDKASMADTGTTPRKLAEKKGSSYIELRLKEAESSLDENRFGGNPPIFITAIQGEKTDQSSLPRMLVTLANFKHTFHPSKIKPGEAFTELMRDVFEFQHDDPQHWIVARDKTSYGLGEVCMGAARDLKKYGSDEKTFFQEVIKIYTRAYLHRPVNSAFVSDRANVSSRKGTDHKLGPYVLMLDALLFYWDELTPYAGKTYRAGRLSDKDLGEYQHGTQFVWLQFVSSLKSEEKAVKSFVRNVLFVINNASTGDNALWLPKDVNLPDLHEYHKKDEEVLYPIGSEFKITKITHNVSKYGKTYTEIELILCCPLY